MNKISDRRKEPRKKLMAFTPVFEKDTEIPLGYIQDLTLQGVLVIGEMKLDIDQQTMLSFELPGGLAGIQETNLNVSARVARCEPDKGSNTYKIGFEFTDIEAEQIEIIEALLKRYHFQYP